MDVLKNLGVCCVEDKIYKKLKKQNSYTSTSKIKDEKPFAF